MADQQNSLTHIWVDIFYIFLHEQPPRNFRSLKFLLPPSKCINLVIFSWKSTFTLINWPLLHDKNVQIKFYHDWFSAWCVFLFQNSLFLWQWPNTGQNKWSPGIPQSTKKKMSILRMKVLSYYWAGKIVNASTEENGDIVPDTLIKAVGCYLNGKYILFPRFTYGESLQNSLATQL